MMRHVIVLLLIFVCYSDIICKAPCRECEESQNTQCTLCFNNYFLLDKKCVTNCPNRYIKKDGQCQLVSDKIQTNSGYPQIPFFVIILLLLLLFLVILLFLGVCFGSHKQNIKQISKKEEKRVFIDKKQDNLYPLDEFPVFRNIQMDKILQKKMNGLTLLAVDPSNKNKYCIKYMNKCMTSNQLEYFNKFSQKTFPNVAEYQNVLNHNYGFVLCREYFNYSLETLCKNKLTVVQIVDYTTQLCNILQQINNSKWMHNNITIHNVMVHKDTVKLTDIGLSQAPLFQSEFYEKPDLLFKPPEYFEEQNYQSTQLSEVWAFGCVVYYMCTGQLPYNNMHDIIQINYKKLPSVIPIQVQILVQSIFNTKSQRPNIKQSQQILQNTTRDLCFDQSSQDLD